MKIKFSIKQLMGHSNSDILEVTTERVVVFHLINGKQTHLCVNDLLGLKFEFLSFHTRTGIKIRLQDVDYMEVIGS